MRRLVDPSHRHTLQNNFIGIALFIGAIWAIFFLGYIVPEFLLPLDRMGVIPRRAIGLDGIVTMPFVHGNLKHIISNTLPLAITLFLLAGSRANSGAIVVFIILLSGSLLWLLGRGDARHIGASGLVFGLIAFHICAGFLEKRLVSIAIAIGVGFLYSTTLLRGIVPFQQGVSWDGHLFGAAAGAIVAMGVANQLKHTSNRNEI